MVGRQMGIEETFVMYEIHEDVVLTVESLVEWHFTY